MLELVELLESAGETLKDLKRIGNSLSEIVLLRDLC